MKKYSLLLVTVLVALFAGLQSCSKAADGAIGPAGPTGAIGPVGAIGATGATGAIGTANVIYSDWANVTFTSSGTSWIGKITAPKITQDILDKGSVKAYFKFGAAVYEGNYVNTPASASIYYYMTVGVINLQSTFNASYPWRYVIIPGGVGARRAAVDYSDYNAVKAAYNLPD